MMPVNASDALLAGGEDPLWNVLIRFLVTALVLFILIWVVYYRHHRRPDELFTFSLIGVIVFLICILLKSVEVQFGMTFGLIAIFALMTFRSKAMSLVSLAYFFTTLGVAVINAMAIFWNPLRGTILINGMILLVVVLLERFKPQKLSKFVLIYENLELFSRNDEAELINDIASITGKTIVRVEIEKVDLIKKQIELVVYYQ